MSGAQPPARPPLDGARVVTKEELKARSARRAQPQPGQRSLFASKCRCVQGIAQPVELELCGCAQRAGSPKCDSRCACK